jgi:hypothetical protein
MRVVETLYFRARDKHFPQNYWVFTLRPSSDILETRKQNGSKTGSVSEMLRFLVSRISDDGQCPKTQ